MKGSPLEAAEAGVRSGFDGGTTRVSVRRSLGDVVCSALAETDLTGDADQQVVHLEAEKGRHLDELAVTLCGQVFPVCSRSL